MSGNAGTTPEESGQLPDPLSRRALTRYLVIPFLVYLLWSLETFLIVGNVHLLERPEPAGLLVWTLVCVIFVGFLLPVFLIQRAFVSGAVNMFQLGFRSWRRTAFAAMMTFLLVCTAVALQNPFGTDRSAFAAAFLLLLPAGASAVMVCWVLAGTHIQALVRGGGAPVSISAGIVVTAILFGLISEVLFPGTVSPDMLFRYLSLGLIAAVFFFSVRDVWAACIAVTGGLVYLAAGQLDAGLIRQGMPAVYLSAMITIGMLAGIHWYLTRHYVTVPCPRHDRLAVCESSLPDLQNDPYTSVQSSAMTEKILYAFTQ